MITCMDYIHVNTGLTQQITTEKRGFIIEFRTLGRDWCMFFHNCLVIGFDRKRSE